MVDSRKNIQCGISLLSSIYVIYVNTCLYNWAQTDAIQYTIQILSLYFVVDTILGYKRYIDTDPLTILHHAIFLFSGISLYYYIYNYGYHYDIYRVIRWVMVMEITSPFNTLRVILNKTKYSYMANIIFAVVFINIRTLSIICIYYELLDNIYFIPFSITVSIITMLNIKWISMIIRKSKNLSFTDYSIPQWNRMTRLTVCVIPLTAICLRNNKYYYSSYVLFLSSIISFMYHYGVKNTRKIGMATTFCVIVVSINSSIIVDNLVFTLLIVLSTAFIYFLSFNKKYFNLYCIVHLLLFLGTICNMC